MRAGTVCLIHPTPPATQATALDHRSDDRHHPRTYFLLHLLGLNMGAAKGYLLLYNIAQSVGWAVALLQTLLAIFRDGSMNNVYAAAGSTVSE